MSWESNPIRSAIACGTAIGLALSACAPIDVNDPNLTPAERQLRVEAQQFNQTVATGAIVGCIAVGVLGAALGAALGGGRGAAEGAAIGCGGGAAAGLATGYYVASRNQHYADTEAKLNGLIEGAQKEAQSYQDIADNSDTIKSQNLLQIAELQKQVKSGQITSQQYQAQTARMQHDIDLLKMAADQAAKTQEQIGTDASGLQAEGVSPEQLTAAQSKLQTAQHEITSNTDAMVRALASAG